ncbi:hypothetical protein E2C01_020238 [Portunus trituberculatus]|uniref:Uncharacterized protein n=1 Tax=Portunus trituberculatus TaxID=210409 RepID=A0A5B7E2M4_PORTR|nr:hypothetical protein [Portunus trituberculatus]
MRVTEASTCTSSTAAASAPHCTVIHPHSALRSDTPRTPRHPVPLDRNSRTLLLDNHPHTVIVNPPTRPAAPMVVNLHPPALTPHNLHTHAHTYQLCHARGFSALQSLPFASTSHEEPGAARLSFLSDRRPTPRQMQGARGQNEIHFEFSARRWETQIGEAEEGGQEDGGRGERGRGGGSKVRKRGSGEAGGPRGRR